MKNNKNPNLNSRKNSWIKALFTLFVVAIPSIMIWFFLSKDFGGGDQNVLNFGYGILISIGFIIAVFLLSYLFYYFKICDVSLFTFSLPVAITFMGIYLSSFLNSTDPNYILYRSLIVLPLTLTVIPINMFITKIKLKIRLKDKIRNKK
ncbi:MAG: MAG3450 family membrane protein [Metamycoplasmataceae bacterium]